MLIDKFIYHYIKSACLASLLGLAVVLCRVELASAHAVPYPKQDMLQIGQGRIALRIDYVVPGADEVQLLRALFDRDRSGSLDPAEQQALLEHLCRQASAFVALTLDEKPLPLARERAELVTPTAADAMAISLTLTAKVTLGDRAHRLRLVDRHKDRAVAVPVHLSTDGMRITTALPPLPLLLPGQALELSVTRTPD